MNRIFPVLSGLFLLSGCVTAGTTADASCATSGTRWTGANSGSNQMNPGMACVACHTSGGQGPHFQIAGTVYTVNDADTCDGVSSIAVEIIGADGIGVTATTNGAGNFSIDSGVKFPYTARVIRNGKANTMSTKQSTGDCNSCHTQTGNTGAPGRILAL